MKNKALLVLLVTSPLYAQVNDAFEASLFDPHKMVRVRENQRTLDPLRPPLPMDNYLQSLLDPKAREERVSKRVKQLIHLDGCDPFKNPRMEKRQWINLVNQSLELVTETFSDALDANPDLKLALLRDTETMKSDPSCINGDNECRLKLRANLELYTSLLSPNYPKEDVVSSRKGANIASPEQQEKMRTVYGIYQQAMKEVMEGRAKGENPSLQNIFHQKSLEAEYLRHTGAIPKDMQKDPRFKGIQLYARNYQGSLADVQNILVAKKNYYEEKIGSLIEPRKGGDKYDARRPNCQAIDLPNTANYFSPNNYMTGKIPISENIVVPCVEKISRREEHKIDINFDMGSDAIDEKMEKSFRDQVLAIFSKFKADGYKVTGYQILASSSQVWGKASPAEARRKNIDLSNRRAQKGKSIVDKIPGFSELDHIPVEKLALDEGVADKKLDKININVIGPAQIPAGIKGKLAENKEPLFEALKADFEKHGLFKTKEEYFKFLEDNKITNVKDATFKPFQFFKIVVEGRKEGDSPCHGISVKSGDAKSTGSQGSQQ